MPPQITLSYTDPSWALEFADYKATLETLLAGLSIIMIEHMGSTSIPDLLAKPIIDVDIEIAPADIGPVKQRLEEAGYFCIGECNIPGRFVFWQPGTKHTQGYPPDGQRRFNTYVCFSDSLSLRNHRDLKRLLLEDPAARLEYSLEKVWILDEVGADTVEWYCQEKNSVIRRLLRKAGWSEEDLLVVCKDKRWCSL